jgi:hypothetical protein
MLDKAMAEGLWRLLHGPLRKHAAAPLLLDALQARILLHVRL